MTIKWLLKLAMTAQMIMILLYGAGGVPGTDLKCGAINLFM